MNHPDDLLPHQRTTAICGRCGGNCCDRYPCYVCDGMGIVEIEEYEECWDEPYGGDEE